MGFLTSMRRHLAAKLAIGAAVAYVGLVANAADYTWDATPGSGSADDGAGTWSTSASGTNWWDGTTNLAWPNLSTDTAIFGAGSGAAGTVTVSGGVTTNGITFNAPGSGTYTLSNGTITLAGSTPTITANVNASISSILAGSAGLVKAGAGTLTLSSSNSFSGGTQVNAGGITLTNGSGLGAGSVGIAASGTVNVNAVTLANALTGSGRVNVNASQFSYANVSGDLSAFTGTLQFTAVGESGYVGILGNYLSGSNAKWVVNGSGATAYLYTSGTTVAIGELSGNGLIGSNYTETTTWEVGGLATSSTFSGGFVDRAFGGAAGGTIFRKVGSGTLTLTGASSHTGGTTVSEGVLALGGASFAPGGSIVVNQSGTLSVTYGGSVTTGPVSGNGTISLVAGAGQPALNADISGFSGTVAANPSANYTGFGANATGSPSARFVLSGGVTENAFYAAVTGTFRMGELSGTAAVRGAGGAGAVTWEIGGLNTNSTFAGSFLNSISGAANTLRKVGSGTLTLSGNNSHSGGTQIDAGAITASNVNAFGSGPVAIGGSGTAVLAAYGANFTNAVTGSGVLNLNSGASASQETIVNFAGDLSGFTGSVVVTSGGDFVGIGGNYLSGSNAKWVVNNATGSFYLYANSGTTVAMGELSGNGRIGSNYLNDTTWEVGALSTSSTFSGVFVDAVAPNTARAILRKIGSGTLTLTGSSSYTGGTQLNAGVIALGNAAALGASGTISFGGGTLQFSGSNTTDYASRIFSSGSAVRLDTNGHNVTFGALGSSNTGGLAKLGGGTLTMIGASSYSGATSVEAGSLVVNGSLASSSAVTIASGATLGGSGTIAGAITGDGLVSPGNSPGILTAAQFDPSGGLDAAFEFTAFSPIYTSATASLNDITRLTNLSDPFASGSFTAANVIDVYFNVDSIANGQVYEGGFFTGLSAASLLEALDGTATFSYWAKTTGTPTRTFGGVDYVALASLPGITGITFQTAARTADFGSGPVTGSVTQFVVVPEPATLALAGIGVAIAAWVARRRR